MNRFSPTERLGVNKVEEIFLKEFGWIPRHIFQSDMGIDMEIEICHDGEPTGQLIGAQIKSGESFFKKDLTGDFIYRGSLVHLNYWLKHSLPIILILHNPKNGLVVWQMIEEKTVTVHKKGWKTEIPSTQILTGVSKNEIEGFNKYPLYFQRLQRLAIHKNLMLEVKSGKKIVVELSEWVNKLIGRAEIKVKKVEDSKERLLMSNEYIYFKGLDSLQVLFPWADFHLDDDFYVSDDEDNFMNEYGIWDSEEKRYISTAISFTEFKSRLPRVRYIEDGSGEIRLYRLEMSLNSLGSSFLEVSNYLDYGKQINLSV